VSLRRSSTLTPALLAANRRNASTGPRTERGENWARVSLQRRGTNLVNRSWRFPGNSYMAEKKIRCHRKDRKKEGPQKCRFIRLYL
jgi:hypothetical protein